MNKMRKLMEMVEAGEYGSVNTQGQGDVEIDGQGIILYEDQVAIYDENGEYQIFLPIETWQAFVNASGSTNESLNEDNVRYDPQPGDDEPLEKPGFNEHGYRTLIRNLPVTGIEGDTFEVTAVDYDASVQSNMAEVDGVMIGWYDKERSQNTYIHIKDLENILNTVKRML